MADTEAVTTAAAAVERLNNRLRNRRPAVEKRLSYLKGDSEHTRFASKEFKDYLSKRFEGFSDNWCLPVAQAPAERMTPLGVRMDEADSKADRDFQRVWAANECDRYFSEAALVMTAASRSFGLVTPPDADGIPGISFEHPSQAIMEDDPGSRSPRYGLVTWTDGGYDYATLYDREGLWRLRRPTSQPDDDRWRHTELFGWEPRDDNEYQAHGFGEVPMFELKNQQLLDDEPMSDIAGVMAMQDAINLVWAYLLNALDFASLPQRVALGAEPPTVPILDESGQEIGERPVELDKLIQERIMFLTGDNVSIGEWKPAALDVFSKVIEHAVEHIAAQTRTPPHYLVARMVNTSAESLTIAEAGLVSKTQERITYVNPALRRMYRLAALATGDTEKARAVRWAQIMWADVQYRSEAQRADALTKKRQVGYPLEYLLELDGVPPWDIPRIIAMREKETSLDPTAQIARGLAEVGMTDANDE